MQHRLHGRFLQVLGRDQGLPRRDLRLDRLLLQDVDHRLDPEPAHLERVLGHRPLELTLFKGLQQASAHVEGHELDLFRTATSARTFPFG